MVTVQIVEIEITFSHTRNCKYQKKNKEQWGQDLIREREGYLFYGQVQSSDKKESRW